VERACSLEDGHLAAIRGSTAQITRFSQQLGFEREVNDIGNPHFRS
jgi:hypothetical protein